MPLKMTLGAAKAVDENNSAPNMAIIVFFMQELLRWPVRFSRQKLLDLEPLNWENAHSRKVAEVFKPQAYVAHNAKRGAIFAIWAR